MRNERQAHEKDRVKLDVPDWMAGRDFHVGPQGLFVPSTVLEVKPDGHST